MIDDTSLPFAFPAIGRKKVTAAFDGGRITSDGGVMLPAEAERRLGIAAKLAAAIPDGRDASRITHTLADILRARIFAIACGWEDADDLDSLRFDPAFKLACGRLPDSGRDLCSQPTMSRWENAPDLRSVIRLGRVMLDLWLDSYPAPPAEVTLDIDDTCNVVHGHQQLSLFNAHYDARCFLPIHIYDTATSRPVAMILRAGKTPSGKEIRGHLRRLVRQIRRRWPTTHITVRGDGHYGRPEAMDWCEANGVDYLFGLPGNRVLDRLIDEAADNVRTRRALEKKPCLRGFTETAYRAKSWKRERRACARIEAFPARSRHPLRRHQPRSRLGRTRLRSPLPRPRPGGESDQAAQEPARLGPHQLPLAAGKPSAPVPAYRCLLADPRAARRHPENARSGGRRVRHPPTAAAEARRPRHRDRIPRPPRLRRSLSARGADPTPRHRPRRTLNTGAQERPAEPLPETAHAAIKSNPTKPGKNPQAHARPISQRRPEPQPPTGVMNKTG